MGYEILSIGYVLELLRSLLQDQVKSLLQRKNSNQIARDLSFRLYEGLREVSSRSERLVISLSGLVESLRKEIPPEVKGNKDFASTPEGSEIIERSDAVNESASNLVETMSDLQETLEEMNLQLEIYAPKVVEKFERFRALRSGVVKNVDYTIKGSSTRYLRSELPRYVIACREELWESFVQAKDNQVLIAKATEEFRSFLADQFQFKESFR